MLKIDLENYILDILLNDDIELINNYIIDLKCLCIHLTENFDYQFLWVLSSGEYSLKYIIKDNNLYLVNSYDDIDINNMIYEFYCELKK